jgi:hypothetical protein
MPKLEDRVNCYVDNTLSGYEPRPSKDPKIIHDSILGSNVFLPHEVIVLDMPIVQRLRRISQVDMVPLVFPSGNHNRFEHTLGVTTISGRLVNALYERKDFAHWAEKKGISRIYALNHVRLAALLHDCGHGPFSHMSEDCLLEFDDFFELKDSDPKFNSVKEHEIMSYLIVRSPAMKGFFNKFIEEYAETPIDLDFVADIIVGNTIPHYEKAFLVDVVNGAFDADKLDYIQRDSHFTGIKMVLDIDRLFHTINAREIKGKQRLTIDMSGVSTLEQIVFSKMMLLCTVYQHHKVRAAECILRSIFQSLFQLPNATKSATAMLELTDTHIYSLAENEDPVIASLARAITNRQLPKRAFVMSNRIITKGGKTLIDLSEFKQKQKGFVDAIAELSGVSSDNIWFDIKKEPKFSEASRCPIMYTRHGSDWVEMSKVFPIDAWIKTFSENKWKAYVFTWPKYRPQVFEATCHLLRKMGVEFDESAAKRECKMEVSAT